MTKTEPCSEELNISRMNILRYLPMGSSYSETHFADELSSVKLAASSLVEMRRKARGNLNSTLRYLKKSTGAEFRTTTLFGLTEDHRLAVTVIVQKMG